MGGCEWSVGGYLYDVRRGITTPCGIDEAGGCRGTLGGTLTRVIIWHVWVGG